MVLISKQFFFKLIILVLCLFIFNSAIYARTSTVIFDCDGVLVDTEYLKYEAWRDVLSKSNIIFTINDYIPLVGHSSEKIAFEIEKAKAKPFDKKLVIEKKNSLYKKRQAQGVPPIQKAVDFLKHLLANKEKYQIKVGLASSAPHLEIIKNLESIGVNPKDFDAIVSGDDDLKHIVDTTGKNKPKPYIYQEIAKSLKVNPYDCIVFEDTHAGIEAASSAGMRAIAVPNQYTKTQDFKRSIDIISFDHYTIQKFERQFLFQ